MTLPIGITMGDPAGVGPEIIVKSLAAMPAADRARYRIFGNRESLAAAKAVLGADLDLATLDLHHTDIPGAPLPFGRLDPRAGEACSVKWTSCVSFVTIDFEDGSESRAALRLNSGAPDIPKSPYPQIWRHSRNG